MWPWWAASLFPHRIFVKLSLMYRWYNSIMVCWCRNSVWELLCNHPVLYVNNRALLLWRSVIDISILLMHNDKAGVGRAVKESGISREKIWITSKLWPTEYGESKTLEAIDKILEHMQLDLFTSQPAILWVHGVIWEKYVHWESVISMQMTRCSRKLWSNRV